MEIWSCIKNCDMLHRIMVLFTLLIIPIFYFAFRWTFFTGIVEKESLTGLYVKGLLFSLPALCIYVFLKKMISPSFISLFSSLSFIFLIEYAFICGVGILTYLLFFGFPVQKRSDDLYGQIFSFFTGFLTLWGSMDAMVSINWFNGYMLFIMPMMRIAFILVIPFIFALNRNWSSLLKIISLLITIPLFLILSLPGVMYYQNQTVFMVISGSLITGISVFSAFFWQIRYGRS